MTSVAERPRSYTIPGRTRGSGPVLAVLTNAPTDPAVAARTGTLLIAAAAVPTTGCSVDALLHHSRDRRLRSRSIAVVARVTPILHAAGVAYFRSTLLLPPGTDTRHGVPMAAVSQLVDRFGAVVVVTAEPLHDPTGALEPVPHHHGPAATPARTPVLS
ncbi:hypothetical protein GCM10020358_19740 [Amorphoplanes nipponensis]|uniref:Uncharacterized protein n=1 Tax=Actinoplanes nipponensis TaxID=135950 RepID=A0A919MNP0_9ACTN|nr:hypothetical protein [Actinoplanes nipponensis]GIE48663.1 hypothetical protein Ani05nite_21970 [Actinoplanes nipponensis]